MTLTFISGLPIRTAIPLAGGQTAADLDPPDFTPEMYLRHARPSGIERVVIVQTGYHQFDNSYATDAIKRFPDVFSVIGIVDETKENVQEDMEALRAQGVRGFRIGVDYDGPQWDRLFEAAARTGQAMCPITHPAGAPAIKEMAAKHPDTTVVVDHMTRVGEMEPINDAHIAQLTDIASLPNTNVKISRLHALGDGPPHDDLIPMIKQVIDAFGPERAACGEATPRTRSSRKRWRTRSPSSATSSASPSPTATRFCEARRSGCSSASDSQKSADYRIQSRDRPGKPEVISASLSSGT